MSYNLEIIMELYTNTVLSILFENFQSFKIMCELACSHILANSSHIFKRLNIARYYLLYLALVISVVVIVVATCNCCFLYNSTTDLFVK